MIKTTKKTKSTTVANKVVAVAAVPAPVLKNHEPKPAQPKVTLPKTSNRVSLELVKPEAKEVYVAGSFNGWVPEKSPLAHKGNGRWVGDLAVSPGRYEYLFVVDGKWLPDPNARETVANPFGGKNSVLLVSE